MVMGRMALYADHCKESCRRHTGARWSTRMWNIRIGCLSPVDGSLLRSILLRVVDVEGDLMSLKYVRHRRWDLCDHAWTFPPGLQLLRYGGGGVREGVCPVEDLVSLVEEDMLVRPIIVFFRDETLFEGFLFGFGEGETLSDALLLRFGARRR